LSLVILLTEVKAINHLDYIMVNKWSNEVTKKSDALDLEEGVFTWNNPRRIAQSLKKSAETSNRRKAEPYQSAMSMLNFYINRGGKNLPEKQRQILDQAKDELKKLYGK
jgi:putative cell wall-binding protein